MAHRRPFPSPRNRRTVLATQIAFQYIDTPSLLALRSTCTGSYVAVNLYLRGTLHTLLNRFVPDPVVFLQVLAPWGALIVGEAALSHILQEPSLCGASLEIAIGNLYFKPFLYSLSRFLPIRSLNDSNSFVANPAPHGFPFYRHITRIAEFRLTSGLFVVVYESSTPSPCDVVCGYWTTAMMNFVTGFSLGCAYPRLTFNALSLNCDTRSSTLAWWDFDMAQRLDLYGFTGGLRCDQSWPLSARGPAQSLPTTITGCGKSLYVCPLQGRFFGDPGSLVVFYDGFCVDLEELRQLGIAPYGPMVAWRVPSTGTCEGRCIVNDPVLPPFIVGMLSQFMEDNSGFVRSQKLTHTIPDGKSHPPVVSAAAFRRGRRYSV